MLLGSESGRIRDFVCITNDLVVPIAKSREPVVDESARTKALHRSQSHADFARRNRGWMTAQESSIGA